jgi:serine/threonine protein kinase
MKFYKSPSGPVSGYRSTSGYTSDEPIDCWFPYRNSYTDGYDTEQTFEYDSRLTQGPLVFVAKHTDPKAIPKLVVVKFTRTYSKAVHNLLAAKGFAPKLFAVEDLAGGWKMVVMEFLLDSDWTVLEMKTHEERLGYKEKLWEALCVIHDKDLVHGDVRGPNIFVSKNGDVKLIDFDHCGTHERDKYPWPWDHTNRPADAIEGGLMRKEHDVFLFDRIFDNSQS